MNRLRGFTLVEVLIALVIAATALSLGLGAVSGSARRLAHVEESASTRWVVENTLNEITLRGGSLAPGSHRFEEAMLGRNYVVTALIERDEKLPILRVSLSVAAADATDIELDHEDVEIVYAVDAR